MIKYIKYLFPIAISGIIGCASDDAPFVPSGSVAGRVVLRAMPKDQFNEPAQDKAGFLVVHPTTGQEVMSNADGISMVEDVPPGTYSVRIHRPGWGETRYLMYYAGGPADYMGSYSMIAPSTISIRGLAVDSVVKGLQTGMYTVFLRGQLIHPGISQKMSRVQAFADTLANPSPDSHYVKGWTSYYLLGTDSTAFSYQLVLDLTDKMPASNRINVCLFSGYGNYLYNFEENKQYYVGGMLFSNVLSVSL